MVQNCRRIKKELLHRRTLETRTFRTITPALSPDDEKYHVDHALTSTALMLWRRWLRVRHCHLYVEYLVNPLLKLVEDRICTQEEVEVALPYE